MHPVPAGHAAVEQLRIHEAFQGGSRPAPRPAEQGRGGLRRQVRPVERGDQRERLLRRPIRLVRAVGEPAQAHLEAGAHAEVAQLEFVQAAAGVGEPFHEGAHLPGRAGRESRAGDAQRQRQVPAQPRRFGCGRPVGRDPLRAGEAAEQRHDVFGGNPEGVPAGDQYPATGARRDEWLYLRRVARVVQHHEQVAVGGEGAELRGRLVLRHHVLAARPERAQEPVEHGDRGLRRGTEVGVQLTVREPVGDLVRGAHRERGLADAAGAVDREHGARTVLALFGQQAAQPRDLRRPAGEAAHVGG